MSIVYKIADAIRRQADEKKKRSEIMSRLN